MSKVDLDALRIDREAAAPRPPRGPRLLMASLVVVTASVAGTFLVPLLRPERVVRTARLRLAQGAAQTARTGVAEAAGWIEPEPFPIHVRPLVAGVMTELLVLEGDAVKKGETVIARLESAELLARRDRAQADAKLRSAELLRAKANLKVAEELLEQKGGPRLAVTQARQELVRNEANTIRAARAHEAAVAERESREVELEGQRRLLAAGGSYPVALAKAEAEVRAAAARAKSAEEDMRRLQTEHEEIVDRSRIVRELSDDPRGLEGDVLRMEAEVERKIALHQSALVEVKIAARELGWCEVKASADGIVLKLTAGPGTTVGPQHSAIVDLYDPARLQARIDVPLASIGGIRAGQEVEVRSEAAPGLVTRGVVLRIQRESDLLKNTTQVKVRLLDPDARLLPETLCRARFLDDPAQQAAEGQPVTTTFLVPRGAVREGAVMIFDPSDGGTAKRVLIEVVGEAATDVIVRGALSITQRVILDAVKDGDSVKEAAE